jgi:hypothetical protein
MAAAMRPELARALVWLEPMARYAWAHDYPWGAGGKSWTMSWSTWFHGALKTTVAGSSSPKRSPGT